MYRGVVLRPGVWDDATLAEWLDGSAGDAEQVVSKDLARELRRCVRAAQRMRDFWLEDDPSRPADAGDWRTRVDMAMGPRAWRPTLAIAQLGLEENPSADLFEEVRERFRVVHSERWMEGVDYQEWLTSG
jgi:hypothetical protein